MKMFIYKKLVNTVMKGWEPLFPRKKMLLNRKKKSNQCNLIFMIAKVLLYDTIIYTLIDYANSKKNIYQAKFKDLQDPLNL